MRAASPKPPCFQKRQGRFSHCQEWLWILALIGMTCGFPSAGHAQFARSPVLNGIDVLARDSFAPLKGLRVGLVTNHTGLDREGNSTIDLLAAAPDVNLVALFSPEHGIRGTADESVDDSRDEKSGLPIYSLYRTEDRRPTAEQLAGLDALAFDIQDIGCRFYTYISTMGLCMEAAAAHGLKFFVFDRVNPIGGVRVDGPIREGGFDFTAYHPLPIQHGMTVGELAQLFNHEKQLGLDLTVIPVAHWKRNRYFDQTGLRWVNPSPNMRSLEEAILYPGIGLLEFTNLSVGRGTDTPFELVGAPFIDGPLLADRLNALDLPGVKIKPVSFTPESSVHEGLPCGGVRFKITNRKTFRALDLGLSVGRELCRLYPEQYNFSERGNRLLDHTPTYEAVLRGSSLAEMRATWQPDAEKFLERRQPFLLYE